MRSAVLSTLLLLLLGACHSKDSSDNADNLLPGACQSKDTCYNADNDLTGTIVGNWNFIAVELDHVSEVQCFTDIDSVGLQTPTNVMSTFSNGSFVSSRSGEPTHCQYKYSQSDRRFYSFDCDSTGGADDTMEVAYLDNEYLVMITEPDTKDTSAVIFSFLFKRIK